MLVFNLEDWAQRDILERYVIFFEKSGTGP